MTDNQLRINGTSCRCEVWEKDYPHGAPMRWVGAFNTYLEAQKFINTHPSPEYYCMRTINFVLSGGSFTR